MVKSCACVYRIQMKDLKIRNINLNLTVTDSHDIFHNTFKVTKVSHGFLCNLAITNFPAILGYQFVQSEKMINLLSLIACNK